jgi:hypothetical protein
VVLPDAVITQAQAKPRNASTTDPQNVATRRMPGGTVSYRLFSYITQIA